MSVKIIGMDKTLKDIDKVAKSLSTQAVGGISVNLASKIENEARNKAPLGPTGNLKRSLHSFRGRNKNLAIAAVDRVIAPHAHFVEFGTSKMSASPFWRPALEANKQGIVNAIKGRVDDSL